ncbi:Fe-S oxidoreductase, partial [Streptomyces sp. NPDC052013]
MQLAAIVVSLTLATVGIALFVRAFWYFFRFFRLGAPLPENANRLDDPWQRSVTLVKEFLGHTRMAQWGLVGFAHWFVALGFYTLVLTILNAFGQLFKPDWVLPVVGGWLPYEMYIEFIGTGTTVGIVMLFVIRQLSLPTRPGRKSRFAGSNRGQAYFVDAVIFIIGMSVMVLRGLEGALHHAEFGAENYVSYGLTLLFDGMDRADLENLVYFFAMLKLAASFIWMITVSLKLDMSVAWHRILGFPNIWFKRNADGSTALGALQPMTSGGKPIDFT